MSRAVLLLLVVLCSLCCFTVYASTSQLEAEIDMEVEGITQGMEEMLAEQAFEGVDEQSSAPMRRLKSRLSSEDDSFVELSTDPAPAAPAARVKKAKRGDAPLPVSVFGVPSVSDEECVICQYFVQRIQNGVADRLDNAPGTAAAAKPSSADPGAGLPGASAAAQQLLHVRNTNSQLQKKPGGRGIVRVITEDIVNSLCAVDKMPILFAPYCSAVEEPNSINALRKGIFFNIPTSEICQQAFLCRDDSYLNTNAGVHTGKSSVFLNSQRGICGMLGGMRDRPTSREGQLINAVCSAHGAVFGQEDA